MVTLLRELGLKTARVTFENGKERGCAVYWNDALSLPMFSEFVKSYRYEKLMSYQSREPRPWRKWD